jgi:phosphoenolpyruvate carboxylase
VEAWVAQDPRKGLAELKRIYRRWPYLRAVLANLDMVLAKADLGIASRYAELVPDRGLRERVFRRIEAEYESTVRAFLAISGQKTLLESNPALARSIRNRIPYIDPLNHLQIELLCRHRAGRSNERVQRGIHLSINGIAAGLRNSG